MYNISDKYKIACKELNRQSRSKIVIDNITYDGSKYIKDYPKFNHVNDKMIGGFPIKSAEFSLWIKEGNIDLINKEIKIYRGLIIDNNIEWIPQGVFYAQSEDVSTSDTGEYIIVKCYDNAKKLGTIVYKDNNNYPLSETDYIKSVISQAGYEVDEDVFVESNYIMQQKPNMPESTKSREIISRYAEQRGAIALFSRLGKVQIKKPTKIDFSYKFYEYKKLTCEKKYGSINQIVIGNKDINNNVVWPTGEKSFSWSINDNPFLDLLKLDRNREIYSQVQGLSLIPFNLESALDSFCLDINDVISIQKKDGTYQDFTILSINTENRLKCKIGASVQNKKNIDYNLSGSVKEDIRNVKFNVDYQKNKIEALASEVTDTKDDVAKLEISSNEMKSSVDNLNKDYEANVTTSKTIDGNPIVIKDAGEYALESCEVEGKSYQETTYGYQLFDSSLIDSTMQSDSSGNGVALINNNDGSFTISKEGTGILTTAFETHVNYSHEKTVEMLKAGNIYIKYDEKTKPYVLLQLRAEGSLIFEVNNYSDNHASGNVTQEMLDNPNLVMRIGFFCPKNTTVTPTTIFPMFYQSGDGTWEKFTGGKPMPNLDYKSEIKTIKGISNLCNITSVSPKSYSNGLPAGDVQALKVESFNSNNINFNITGNGNYIALTNTLELEPLTDYILSYERTDIIANANSRHYIYSVDSNNNYALISNALSGDAGKKEISFKTTESGKVAFGFGFAANANNSKTEIKNIKIEKGIESHDYAPFGSWLLNKTHNKNFFNKNDINEGFRIGIDGNLTSSGIYCVSEYIEVISKQKYIFNKTRTALYNRIAFYNKDFEILGVESTADNAITTPENTKYLRFGWLKDDIENLQLEEGDSSTDYEEFKENKALVDLNIYDENNNIVDHHELVEIDNIKDSYKDGVLTKKINKIVLNGTENWVKNTSSSNVNGYYEFSTTITNKPSKQVLLMCDSLEVGNAYNNSKEQIRNRTDKQIYINIKGERLETQDVEGFKKYLSENNITVYYEIDPKTYEVVYERLKLFKNYNFITLNDELYPNMKIKYLTDSKLNAQYVTHAEHKITSDNITSSLNKKITDTNNETIEDLTNTIEQKISDSEVSTESKINVAKTGAINSANNSTDNKLKNYSTTIQMNNAITQKITDSENSINLEVSQKISDATTAAQILLKINNDTSSTLIKSDKVDVDAIATFTNSKLKESGSTIINADNIITGTINAERLDSSVITTKNFNAQKINADNITSGSITADRIHGGTFTGSSINLNNKFKVDESGSLDAVSGKIGGWQIGATSLTNSLVPNTVIGLAAPSSENVAVFYIHKTDDDTWPIFIRANGYLSASNVNIKGQIQATSGSFSGSIYAGNGSTIGGLTMTNGILSNERMGLDAINGIFRCFNNNGGSMILSNAVRLSATAGVGITSSSTGNISAPSHGGIDIIACSGHEAYMACANGADGSSKRSSVTCKNGTLALYAATNCTYNGGNIFGSSSQHSKENIVNLTNEEKTNLYNLIKNIPLKKYDYKKEYGNKFNYGFIIEDIENTLLAKLLHINNHPDDENLKYYSSEDLTRLELVVIQELMKKIEKMEEKLCQLI